MSVPRLADALPDALTFPEVKLEPPVNRVLPVGRTHLARLRAAFGAGGLE